MDVDIVQQIYPIVKFAGDNLENFTESDKGSLTADLYLGMVKYKNKEIPKFLARLQRLEDLKRKDGKLKDQQFLDNLQKQQDTILEESKQKQYDLLNTIYKKWLEER